MAPPHGPQPLTMLPDKLSGLEGAFLANRERLVRFVALRGAG